jgi:hypothetical protein
MGWMIDLAIGLTAFDSGNSCAVGSAADAVRVMCLVPSMTPHSVSVIVLTSVWPITPPLQAPRSHSFGRLYDIAAISRVASATPLTARLATAPMPAPISDRHGVGIVPYT